jgi:hypothetical protein
VARFRRYSNCYVRLRRGRLGSCLVSAAFDTDAIIAAMENQSLAGYIALPGIGHPGRRRGGAGQHIVSGHT